MGQNEQGNQSYRKLSDDTESHFAAKLLKLNGLYAEAITSIDSQQHDDAHAQLLEAIQLASTVIESTHIGIRNKFLGQAHSLMGDLWSQGLVTGNVDSSGKLNFVQAYKHYMLSSGYGGEEEAAKFLEYQEQLFSVSHLSMTARTLLRTTSLKSNPDGTLRLSHGEPSSQAPTLFTSLSSKDTGLKYSVDSMASGPGEGRPVSAPPALGS